MGRVCNTYWEKQRWIQGFSSKTPNGPLGRPRLRWENNMKMDLQEIGWGKMDWFGLGRAQESSSFECSKDPSFCTQCGEFLLTVWENLSFSWRMLFSTELTDFHGIWNRCCTMAIRGHFNVLNFKAMIKVSYTCEGHECMWETRV